MEEQVKAFKEIGEEYIKDNKLTDEQILAFIGYITDAWERGSSFDEWDVLKSIK